MNWSHQSTVKEAQTTRCRYDFKANMNETSFRSKHYNLGHCSSVQGRFLLLSHYYYKVTKHSFQGMSQWGILLFIWRRLVSLRLQKIGLELMGGNCKEADFSQTFKRNLPNGGSCLTASRGGGLPLSAPLSLLEVFKRRPSVKI